MLPLSNRCYHGRMHLFGTMVCCLSSSLCIAVYLYYVLLYIYTLGCCISMLWFAVFTYYGWLFIYTMDCSLSMLWFDAYLYYGLIFIYITDFCISKLCYVAYFYKNDIIHLSSRFFLFLIIVYHTKMYLVGKKDF